MECGVKVLECGLWSMEFANSEDQSLSWYCITALPPGPMLIIPLPDCPIQVTDHQRASQQDITDANLEGSNFCT